MSLTALILTLTFVGIAIILSLWQHLQLEKDLIIGTIRAAIQLTAVGYILQIVFDLNEWPYLLLIILIMLLVAAQNAARRGKGINNIFIKILISIAAAEIIAMAILLGFHIVDSTPRFIIPLSGMVIGNAMISCGLFLNRLFQEIRSKKDVINVALSLGATSKQAINSALRNSVRASTIPVIDGLKTVGLVQLPGMMTGLIIGGTSPIEAVRYQLLILFSLTAVTTISSMILAFLTYPSIFTEAHQLKQIIK
ncbi:MAG: iron export ABC transporter permease subunit FetB [Clostridiales bacterium]|nr:iron export ABC transporter permease subunit FetB [Clostridiales bacterium]MCF8023657.1 iron export ABC transporter permease subunit FetB [Clostridiales bacterium]